MDDQDGLGRNQGFQILLHEILALLIRRRKLILTVLSSGVATATLLALFRGPVYQATARLMVTSQRARVTVSPDPGSASTVDRLTEQDLNAEVALLSSLELVRDVAKDEIGETEQPGRGKRIATIVSSALDLPAHLYRSMHHVPPLGRFEKLVLAIAPEVTVRPVGNSNLIDVSYTCGDPEWAARFVNRLVERHVERRARMNQQSQALSFLESQRRLLSDKQRAAESILANFYTREGIDAAPEQRETLRTQLAAQELALATATTDLAEGTARAAFLSQEVHSGRAAVSEPAAPQTGPLQLLRTRIVDLQLQRNELLTRFAPTSLKVQDLDRQIEEARRLLAAEERATAVNGGGNGPLQLELAQTQAQMAALKARVEALRSRIAGDRATLAHLDQIAAEQERLEQDVAAAKEAFLTYSKKVEESRFSNALDASGIVNVTIAEPAQVPVAPQPSKRGLIIVLGAIMSLFAGLGLAFARDRLDPAVKSSAEAERLTGLPILADIPL